jgi:DeoR/GlpR family transcriptional regulator of sugar metabolism
VALQLTEHPNVQLNLLGGKVLKNAQVSIGLDIIDSLHELRADLCFVGTRSLSAVGITDINREEAQVKRALMDSARKCVSLCISEKLGTVQPYLVAKPDKLDILITELSPVDSLLIPYSNMGLQLI